MAKSILIVDDDQDDQLFLIEAFRQIGIDEKIHSAYSRMKALELLEELKGDLPVVAILDVNMPVMSGLELLPEIKNRYNIPVIVHTTTCTEDVIRTARQNGAIDCVKKGTSFADNMKFGSMVLRILKESR